MKATAIELGAGRLSLVSHPEEVADPVLLAFRLRLRDKSAITAGS
jgi:hypothetical protein